MIAEPTLEHYFYYLRQVEGDNRQAIQERRAAFEDELRALLAHLERLSGQAIPAWEWPQESQDRRASQRIVRTHWLDNPVTGGSYFVGARIYGDVYWLQVGYSQQAQARPEIFASLRDEAWQPSATNHLLGNSVYLCGIAANKVDQLATQALEAYTGDTSGTVVPTHLANGCVGLYGLSQSPYVAVLFYPDAGCEEWTGRTFLNDIAVRLELYKHKTDRQLAWCEANHPLLSEQEQSLRVLLQKVIRTSPDDLELLQQFVQHYRVFNSNVGMLIGRQAIIDVNLGNLDIVIEDLGPLAEDYLLSAWRDRLRRHQRQLEADLRFADRIRQQADLVINALTAELGLERLIDLRGDLGSTEFKAGLIERNGFPGVQVLAESEMEALVPRPRPSQPVAYPQVNNAPTIVLADQERTLIQRIFHPGYDQVLVEKGFSGGYSGTRVLLTLPVRSSGLSAARKVTKLGPALELHREWDNYERHVGDFLPFCAARVERYYEQDDQGALNYVFVGGGALGQVMELEEYYRRHPAERVKETLDVLLDRELGQRWYSQTTPLHCFFAAEYGRHLVEHLRLKLRPASADALWPVGQAPAAEPAYRQTKVDAIAREYETVQAGTLLSVEGLVVKRIKHDEVKLEDPGGQGIIVRVKFAPEGSVAQRLELGSRVGVRGEVIHNRCGRMEQIVRDAFPALSGGVGGERIELPGVPGMYPNPLFVYPQVLSTILEGRQSYVHGDLHLRNVLVDEGGRGWLIDFARVEERHNLFDFIKLETYVRLMGLAGDEITFSHGEYVQFEEVLTDATLEREGGATCPNNPQLEHAYQVILAIRQIARNYMAQKSNAFLVEYFPALFLYCLAVTKFYQENRPQPTRLVFVTASVLSRYILGISDEARPTTSDAGTGRGPPDIDDRPSASSQRNAGRREAVMAKEARVSLARQPIEPVPTRETKYLRECLVESFASTGEVYDFCQDNLEEMLYQWPEHAEIRMLVRKIIAYCQAREQLDILYEFLVKKRPGKYARYYRAYGETFDSKNRLEALS